MEKLPLYKVVLADPTEGILKISLVDNPAVQSDWEMFSEQKMNFAIQDEEERIVTGCFLRADYPILRKRGDEYFNLIFDKEVIKTMVMKWMAEGRANLINQQHQSNTNIDEIYLEEVFIKNKDRGIDPKGFEDVADGSAFATYKIYDDDIWEKVKDGTFNGFSIEMSASIEKVEDKEEFSDESLMDDIINIMNKLIKK